MPEIVTEVGDARVRGFVAETRDGAVETYRGIVYGRAERFRPAVEVTLHGEIDATGLAAEAPQFALPAFGPRDEHACLNLTVWRPVEHDEEPLPVLVWIHGGAHMIGSNAAPMTDGGRLAARENLVVVAVNYRLGALGHLWLQDALGDEHADSGNLALTDQQLALEWVQRNIAAFAGDPGNVTIMGESSGATDVLAHLASDAAGALFHRAIAQSGTTERASTIAQATQTRDDFLAVLGLRDPAQLLTIAVDDLIAGQDRFVQERTAGRPSVSIPFHPIIDERTLHADRLARIACRTDVPLMVGANRNESSGWIDIRPGATQDVPDSELTRFVDASTAALRAAYVADRGFEPNRQQLLEAVLSELLYRRATQRLIDARGTAPTYAVLFDWARDDVGEWPAGAHHALEVPFVFRHHDDLPESEAVVGAHPPQALSDRMSAAVGSFARAGEPTSEPDWQPYGNGAGECMVWAEKPYLAAGIDCSIRRIVEDWGYTYDVR